MRKHEVKVACGCLTLILAFVGLIIVLISCPGESTSQEPPKTENNYPTLSWSSDGLFAQLPPPTTEYGTVLVNTSEQIKIELNGITESDKTLYVQLCMENGYNGDMKSSDFFYSATNYAGYRVTVQYTAEKKLMTVSLDGSARMEIIEIGAGAFIGMAFEEAVDTIKSLGFDNVTVRAVATPEGENYADGTVESVTINSKSFESGDAFPRSTEVVVRYYIKSVVTEFASAALVGKPVSEVEKLVREAGFANVTVIAVADYNGNVADGTVIAIAVNGAQSFEVGAEFSPNAAVHITYYTSDTAAPRAASAENE